MNIFAAIKKAFGLEPKDPPPAPPMSVSMSFEWPPPNLLPTLPGVTTTVHTRAVLTERVECSISPTPTHDITIVIVDNVVKSISSPCDFISALTAAQLGGKSCAQRYQEIRAWLLGMPKRGADIIDSRDPLDRPITEAIRRRGNRLQLRTIPAAARTTPRIWERFIQRTTNIAATIIVDSMSARVYLETPGVVSMYSLLGNGTPVAPHVWALGNGPGNQRVYDLLNKYVKRNSKLVAK